MSEATKNSLIVAPDPFLPYRNEENGEVRYSAGLPRYVANFSRDTFIAGIIAGHSELLRSQIAVSSHFQGEKDDPLTGEMPGRVHHEYPGAVVTHRGIETTYNACDTTPLMLIAAEGLLGLEKGKHVDWLSKRKENFERAVGLIVKHVDKSENLFWENPPKGASHFDLRVTYWKDSILPNIDGKEEPVYPVTYALAHFIAARGLISASKLLKEPQLKTNAEKMFRAGIAKFIQPGQFVVYEDQEETRGLISSDELHALAYIPDKYAELLPLDAIQDRAKALASPIGFTCMTKTVADRIADDKYHGHVVWVFEQALHHYGATKYRLHKVAEVASRVAKHIGMGQELFGFDSLADGTVALVPMHNPQQLWSVAAAEYFSGRSNLRTEPWL